MRLYLAIRHVLQSLAILKSPEKLQREKARAEFEKMAPTGAGAFLVFEKQPLRFPDRPCGPTKPAEFK